VPNVVVSTSASLTISSNAAGELTAHLTTIAKGDATLNASLSIVVTSHARVSQVGVEYMQSALNNVKAKLSQLAVEYMQSNQSIRARLSQLGIEYMQKVAYELTITPTNATSNGYVPITYHARLTGSNGTVIQNPKCTWSISGSVGTIDPTSGVFTPNGTLGTVVVTCTTTGYA
jgi:hypothetical protein